MPSNKPAIEPLGNQRLGAGPDSAGLVILLGGLLKGNASSLVFFAATGSRPDAISPNQARAKSSPT